MAEKISKFGFSGIALGAVAGALAFQFATLAVRAIILVILIAAILSQLGFG